MGGCFGQKLSIKSSRNCMNYPCLFCLTKRTLSTRPPRNKLGQNIWWRTWWEHIKRKESPPLPPYQLIQATWDGSDTAKGFWPSVPQKNTTFRHWFLLVYTQVHHHQTIKNQSQEQKNKWSFSVQTAHAPHPPTPPKKKQQNHVSDFLLIIDLWTSLDIIKKSRSPLMKQIYVWFTLIKTHRPVGCFEPFSPKQNLLRLW